MEEDAVNSEDQRQGMVYGGTGTETGGQETSGLNTAYYGQYNAQNRNTAPNDHTAEFGTEDIAGNKIFAVVVYLMGIVGIIIALLAAKSSRYVLFHVRQALKLSVCTMLLVILAIPFALMSFVPYIGILFQLVVGILAIAEIGIVMLRIAAFFQVCDGKAKEPVIIGKIFN